jgi:heme/copper-type cytochrome/quinol oxidase subunit 1
MPKLSVWLVRASLVHMGIGFLFGALILYHKGVPLFTWMWRLLNLHVELMIFGWTMQLVMGVAFFALPRFSQREQRYGPVRLGWWSFYLLNSGVILTAVAHWYNTPTFVLLGRLLVLLAIVAFVILIWPRVRPFGSYSAS